MKYFDGKKYMHICYDKGNYTIDMECCKHSICWNCLPRLSHLTVRIIVVVKWIQILYCRITKLTKTKNPFY